MGEPVKIKDLAMKMISLSGRSIQEGSDPQSEIAIELIGLRPGEKLYEELLISGDAAGTAHPRIWQARENAIDAAEFEKELELIEEATRVNPQSIDIGCLLQRWVTGYVSQTVRD